MKKGIFKRIVLWSLGAMTFLVLVLAVHIYVVTRPKAPDASTRVMVRIDIKQPITRGDADRMTAWLYGQQGVDRVMVNPGRDIVLFTYFPIKTTGDLVLRNFKSNFAIRADRYLPKESEMSAGCPAMATNSFSYKLYNFFKNHF
jgi:hypothetical protein